LVLKGRTHAYVSYPPDWDPSKGSINAYHNSHPLRARARKLDQGILVVRFEMPWNAWCLHCNIHIGQGIRFNAEKKTVDHYYTTPIFQFRMKCRSCSGWMEIRTNPKEADFECIEGVKKKAEDYRPSDDEPVGEDGERIFHNLSKSYLRLSAAQKTALRHPPQLICSGGGAREDCRKRLPAIRDDGVAAAAGGAAQAPAHAALRAQRQHVERSVRHVPQTARQIQSIQFSAGARLLDKKAQ
jgi:hypothetical protein